MSAVGTLAKGLLGVIPNLLMGGKKPDPTPQAVPVPVVDQSAAAAAASQANADDVRRRRGAGANELTGGGAEASTPGAKVLLGQ